MESNKNSYNGKAQWEAVQCTRTITLFELIIELLPFLTILIYIALSCSLTQFSCPENNFKTKGWNLIKLHIMIQHSKRKCIVQEPELFFHLISELLHFVIFSCLENNLKTIRWNLIKIHTMVKLNAVQWTRTITLVWANYRVIALSYFSISEE